MNRRFVLFFTFLFLLFCTVAEAQRTRRANVPKAVYKLQNWHGAFSFIAGGGFCSYFGDLKDNRTDLWATPSAQIGVQYRVNNRMYLRSEIVWYRISGADSLNSPGTGIYNRNLSFRADNFEWNAVGMLYLFNKYGRRVTSPINPYVFGGLGVTTNTPKAFYEGEWYSLRPLETEGVSYSSIVPIIPAGVGVSFHLSESWDVSLEYGYRFSFSDYLDDVSTVFKGVENFDDPIARALSDRRPEMDLPALPAGNIRGNSGVNDWYLVMGLKLIYTPTLKPKSLKDIECRPLNNNQNHRKSSWKRRRR